MTVENETNFKRVEGDGVTPTMTFNFRVLQASDLVLSFIDTSTGVSTEKTVDVDYTVALESDGEGGTVTFIDIPAVGEDAFLINILALTQPADLPTEGNFNEETVEIALDRSRLIDIQQQEELNRCIKIPQTDPLNDESSFTGLELPTGTLAERASKIWGWNAAGTAIIYYGIADIDSNLVSSFMLTLLDDETAADARTTIGAAASTDLANYLPLTGGTLTGKLNTKASATGAAGLNIPHGTAPSSPVNGDIWTVTDNVFARLNGVTFGLLQVLQSYISGLLITGLTGNSTTANATVGTGQASDSTNSKLLSAGSTFSWAVSNGNAANGYQGGTTLPNSSTIHMYVIALPTDTGWTASFASTSLAPTLPGSYTLYRRVGSFRTDGSGNPYVNTPIEIGGGAVLHWLSAQLADVAVTGVSSTARILYTLTVPAGIKVAPQYRYAQRDNGTGTSRTLITSGDEGDAAVAAIVNSAFNALPGFDSTNQTGLTNVAGSGMVTTNTSGQIGIRQTGGSADVAYTLVTRGWIDFRR